MSRSVYGGLIWYTYRYYVYRVNIGRCGIKHIVMAVNHPDKRQTANTVQAIDDIGIGLAIHNTEEIARIHSRREYLHYRR